jgi:hypothetical protein
MGFTPTLDFDINKYPLMPIFAVVLTLLVPTIMIGVSLAPESGNTE